jgi:hypothetical protein
MRTKYEQNTQNWALLSHPSKKLDISLTSEERPDSIAIEMRYITLC